MRNNGEKRKNRKVPVVNMNGKLSIKLDILKMVETSKSSSFLSDCFNSKLSF